MEIEDIISELQCILPGDLMLEILSRLPIKSLVKFSCVKRSWYDLIKSPSFIKMQYSFKVKEDDGYIIRELKYSNKKMESELFIVRRGSIKPAGNVGLPESGNATIVGSSNGLVCLTYLDQRFGVNFKVINPALRKHRYVYKASNHLKVSKNPGNCTSIGFGYDKKSGDFKILRMERVEQGLGLWYSDVDLYSLCSDSWKRVPSLGDMVFKSSICTAVIGSCLYWLSSLKTGNYVITGFDLSTETFNVIPLPKPMNRECVQVVAWNRELLAVLSPKHESHDYDLWIISPDLNHDPYKLNTIETLLIGNGTMSFPFENVKIDLGKNKSGGCIMRWQTTNVFPGRKIIERVTSCQICYYRESLVPIMDASKRKHVGVSKHLGLYKLGEWFLKPLLCFWNKIFKGTRTPFERDERTNLKFSFFHPLNYQINKGIL